MNQAESAPRLRRIVYSAAITLTLVSGSARAEPATAPYAAVSFPEAFAMHGVGGDEVLLFGVVPADAPTRDPGVVVAHRRSGDELGTVPAPPVGWITPLSIAVLASHSDGDRTDGSFLLLDAGGDPNQAGTVTTYLHRYRYQYAPSSGFAATWIETHRLPASLPVLPGTIPTGIVYTSGFTLLPDGMVAVDDTIAGAIWVSDATLEHWRLAIIDPDLAGGRMNEPAQGVGRAPGGGTRAYTFMTPYGLLPGVHSMAYAQLTDELVVNRTATPGGIFAIPRGVLLNALIPAPLKTTLKRAVIAPTPGLSDLGDGIAYDRFHPTSPWIYFMRSIADASVGFANTLRRVHLRTGEIQEVASSNQLYDFTNNLAALPPLPGHERYTTIAAAMGQEENNAEVNTELNGVSRFVAPELMTLVEVSPD